ncbi:hypothetical protein QO017_003658 [Methylobacterium gregans]|nr:hypothetical protein [Methylobacterium gregans]
MFRIDFGFDEASFRREADDAIDRDLMPALADAL